MTVQKTLVAVGLLTTLLIAALFLRVEKLHAAEHGPAGGSGIVEGTDVNVTARIAARIAAVDVHEGDTVKEGQLVVELDCAEPQAALDAARSRLAVAEAALTAARASATSAARSASAGLENVGAARSQLAALRTQEAQARMDMERAEENFRAGALTRAAYYDARSRHDTLAAQIEAQESAMGARKAQAGALDSSGAAARAQVLVAQGNADTARAEVAQVEVNVRECKLYAPRDAIVVTRNFQPGEAVQPGMAILSLTDLALARVYFYLPNEELAAAAPGKKVTVVADAYPGRRFSGTIARVSPRAEFTPRNVQTRQDRERLVYAVEVRIPNQDLKLRSGMPVEVSIDGTWE